MIENNMEGATPQEEVIFRLMADGYVDRILSTTYMSPTSVKDISKICEIPIAVAYRRVSKMEKVGLLKCVRQEEVYRGNKVKYYQCAVRGLRLIFVDRHFKIEVEWLPDYYQIDISKKGDIKFITRNPRKGMNQETQAWK
jgi:predicted transcriptional regulator